MTTSPARPAAGARLAWIDISKGICIILIVFFHFFGAYDDGRYPWPLGWSNLQGFLSACAPHCTGGTIGRLVEGWFVFLFQRGPHAVGVFLVLSGFGLTYALAKGGTLAVPQDGWGVWYRRRLLRLFPMYWLAHLLYLISPFVHRKSPLNPFYFLLSMVGDRIVPVDTMFYYINPSWWFFGLLLELYLVYPLLFLLLKKLGSVKFLFLCGLITLCSRYLLTGILEANGNYIQGAFFGARLWEFAVGMVLALTYRRRASQVEEGLSSWKVLAAGLVIYTVGIYSYAPGFTYVFSDALEGTGLFMIIGFLARWISNVPWVAPTLSLMGAYSYGIYLLHQPYMIYAGERLNGGTMTAFIVYGFLLYSAVALVSIPLEWYVNRLSARLLDR